MLLDAPALSLDADCAGDGRAGGDCDFHGETVAEGLGWGQWGRVRVSGNGKRRRRPCAAPLPWIPAFAGKTMGVCPRVL